MFRFSFAVRRSFYSEFSTTYGNGLSAIAYASCGVILE
jgi:hypothetical protein